MTRMAFYKVMPRLPHINKNDIRKQYVPLFVEALNSGDLNRIWAFFRTCCTTNIHVTQHWNDDVRLFNFPERTDIIGIDLAVEYYFLKILLAPDLIANTHGARLHVRSDKQSYVEAYVYFKGNHIDEGPYSHALFESYHCDEESNAGYSSYRDSNEEDRLRAVYQRAIDKFHSVMIHINPLLEQSLVDEEEDMVAILKQGFYLPQPEEKQQETAEDNNETGSVSELSTSTPILTRNEDIHPVNTVGHFMFHINEEMKVYRIEYKLTLMNHQA